MKSSNSVQSHDESETARDEMIVNALPLVTMLAKHIAQRVPPSVTIDELISAGTIGLIKAAHRFDAKRGLRFGTYARHRVRGEMLDFLRSLDPLSRGERRAQRDGTLCSQVPPATWVSLDVVLNEVSKIRSEEEHTVDWMSRAQITSARRHLSDTENRILELSFDAGWRNREIARHMGVTEGRISQIRTSALAKLRASLA